MSVRFRRLRAGALIAALVGVGLTPIVANPASGTTTGKDRILSNMDRLRDAGVWFGRITVLHRGNVDRIDGASPARGGC